MLRILQEDHPMRVHGATNNATHLSVNWETDQKPVQSHNVEQFQMLLKLDGINQRGLW